MVSSYKGLFLIALLSVLQIYHSKQIRMRFIFALWQYFQNTQYNFDEIRDFSTICFIKWIRYTWQRQNKLVLTCSIWFRIEVMFFGETDKICQEKK